MAEDAEPVDEDAEALEVDGLSELEDEEETPWSDGEKNEQFLSMGEQAVASPDIVSANISKMARLLALRIAYGSKTRKGEVAYLV
eukprot:4098087-Amphidinium_carterae.1